MLFGAEVNAVLARERGERIEQAKKERRRACPI
jgi:hypothetical protein